MAVNIVKYKITGEDDTKKATDSAVKNLDKLGNATKTLGNVLKAVGVGFSVAKIIQFGTEGVKAFESQEKSELRLIAASRNNPYINGAAITALKQTAKAYQGVTEFSDEAIMQNQAPLVGMGLNKDQIDAVMNAAVNLAATGVTTLDGAVRNLGKTYGGVTGELGELVPALKNLTAEQLKAGAGVEYIGKQYAGMAESAASGVAGTMAKVTNSFSDLKASIGNILGTVAGAAATALQPAIASVTGWLSKHRDEVVGFFINFPKIAGAAFDFAGKVIQKVFTLDFLWNLVKALFEFVKKEFFSIITLLWGFLQAIGISFWEPLRVGFEWVGIAIETAWQAVVKALVAALNWVLSGVDTVVNGIIKSINAIVQSPLVEKLFGKTAGISEVQIKISEPDFKALTEPKPIDAKGIVTAWNKALAGIVPFVIDTAKNVIGLASDIGVQFKDEFAAFTDEVGNLIQQGAQANREATKNLQDVVDSAKENAGTPIPTQTEGLGVGTGPAAPNPLEALFASILPVINSLVASFAPFLTSLASVNALLNPLQTIFTAMMTVLGPLIDNLLTPMVGILVILGKTLGMLLVPVLQLLTPVVVLLSSVFVFLYNYVLLPIINALMAVFNFIYGLIAGIWNAVVDLLNGIDIFGWHPFNLNRVATRAWNEGFLEPINESDLNTAGSTVTGSGGTGTGTGTGGGTGTAASYQQAPTYNVTINIYPGIDIGDPDYRRKVAIVIRDELDKLTALGV